MGVDDTGKVVGLPEKTATDMIRNFIGVISNPALFSPTIYLTPKIVNYDKHTVIHVHVPPSAEVHSYKRVIYDRVNDADVKVTATGQIASMYIRKQSIFTEKKIYPYVTMSDLRLDLLPRVRKMAVNFAGGSHPWEDMSEQELLISAGLYGTDMATGEKGFNLAAIMLLGKDDLLMEFAKKHLPDNLEPNPKNPIIASFFRNIGRADKLGSGVRNLFKYSKYYSGKEPEFIEGDIFRIIVPLDEAYSFDIGVDKVDLTDQTEKKADQTSRTEITKRESQLLEVIKNYPEMTNEDISQELKWSVSKVKYYMKKLKKIGIIKRNGSSRKGFWDIYE